MSVCEKTCVIKSCSRISKGCIKTIMEDIKPNLFIIIGNVHCQLSCCGLMACSFMLNLVDLIVKAAAKMYN